MNQTGKITARFTSSALTCALIALAALVGMALVVYATVYGPGIGGDATIYLTSAQNFLAGRGLGWIEADGSFRVLPYTPPFYPLVLSALGLFVKDLAAGARWLNVLLFGALVGITGWTFSRSTGRPWLAGLLALAVAASPVLVGVTVWAMSEPLTLITGFAGLLLLLAYFNRPRPGYLYGSAILVGLSLLARYIGVAFVLTAGLALLVFWLSERKKVNLLPWRELILYGLASVLPMLVWIVVDLLLTGTLGSRSGQSAADYVSRLLEMCPALEKIYLFWLLPESMIGRLPGVVRLFAWLLPLVVVMAAGVWVRSRLRAVTDSGLRPAARLALLMAAFIVVYLVVLAVVQVFTYPPITLASRMLSPVHLAALVLLFALGSLAISLFPRVGRATAVLVVAVYAVGLGMAGSYALRGALIAREYHRTGIGYTSPVWQKSQVIEAVRSLPESTPLISNDVTALMFLADRPAYTLQEIFQTRPSVEFMPYGAGDDESQRIFREERGALVLFYASLEEDFSMYGDRTAERLSVLTQGLELYYQGEDGAIYFYR